MLKIGLFGCKLNIPTLGDEKSTITGLMRHTQEAELFFALSGETPRSHKAWKSGSHTTELEDKD